MPGQHPRASRSPTGKAPLTIATLEIHAGMLTANCLRACTVFCRTSSTNRYVIKTEMTPKPLRSTRKTEITPSWRGFDCKPRQLNVGDSGPSVTPAGHLAQPEFQRYQGPKHSAARHSCRVLVEESQNRPAPQPVESNCITGKEDVASPFDAPSAEPLVG